ncbi:telomere repeat-binding protein 5-like isoform X2 [Asparagus officinalis]|uniref:telomere repeat-binding protein 5-like isoform X2 n=1 Tax=Asparagus officinalis TaxID=4686 RepID=UPI00098E339B|nr:telomere repeat-binding protein 5-like isoform X2 [Asparagus officinalis]
MVLHKRLDYGSIGYQVPPMPRVPRSAKGKRSIRKKLDNKQISAFDLLATVAGELLSERENSLPQCKISGTVNPTIKQEQQENEMPFKAEVFDQGSCNESTLGSESAFKRQISCKLEKPSQTLKSLEGKKGELSSIAMKCDIDGKVEIGQSGPGILEDPMDLDAKPPALVSSDSSVKVPISRSSSFSKSRDKNELVDGDGDENSSWCTHPCTDAAKAFRLQRIGDRRIRKLLASKIWKVPPKVLKDGELSNNDVQMKTVFGSKKMCYTRQRTQRSPFKRRKLFEHRPISVAVGGIYGEGIPKSAKFGGLQIERNDGHAISKSSYDSVKFTIKSFKVPELFIEIPETATVGSLKRTVMEAVTAVLAGGLRVGVLLQGKKVRDDKQTLLQAGISHKDKMDNLGFSLEPNSTQAPPPPLISPEDPNPLLLSNPIQRISAPVPVIDQMLPETLPEQPQTSTLNSPESDHDSGHSHTEASSSVDKNASLKALVPVPDMNSDSLAVIPSRKPKQTELVQRRIRRPFSVAEVEALVQAVEKLGTGRWRDVKIRAFDNAKHRTYVDLKDKWKTLVHTARISPQQRRGEPVPQELLDRVLLAHSYWAQQQAKLQSKPN